MGGGRNDYLCYLALLLLEVLVDCNYKRLWLIIFVFFLIFINSKTTQIFAYFYLKSLKMCVSA